MTEAFPQNQPFLNTYPELYKLNTEKELLQDNHNEPRANTWRSLHMLNSQTAIFP